MSKTLDKYIRDNEKSVMANNEENVKAWEEKFNLIMDKVRGHQSKYIKRIFGKFKRGLFPAAQFITLDCLDVQDVPYHIQ